MLSEITDLLLLCQLASCPENVYLWPQTTWFTLASKMHAIHYKRSQKRGAWFKQNIVLLRGRDRQEIWENMCVVVKCVCQLDWATGCPDIG